LVPVAVFGRLGASGEVTTERAERGRCVATTGLADMGRGGAGRLPGVGLAEPWGRADVGLEARLEVPLLPGGDMAEELPASRRAAETAVPPSPSGRGNGLVGGLREEAT